MLEIDYKYVYSDTVRVRRGGLRLSAAAVLLSACARPAAPPPADVPVIEPPAAAPAAPAAERPSGRVETSLVIDEMEEATAWRPYDDGAASVSLAAVPGDDGNAVEIRYNLRRGDWAGAWRLLERDAGPFRGVRFRYRCEGPVNTLEVKMEDPGGTNHGRAVKTDARSWTTVDLPFSSLLYWWGPDDGLDLANLKFHIAVSRKEGDAGGEGRVLIDRLEFLE